jgi:rhamnogalacturonan endolyase
MRRALALLAAVCVSATGAEPAACTRWGTPGAMLYQDDFAGPLHGWVAEYARKPGNTVDTKGGRLLMDVDGGATVWLDKPLSGNVLIAFTRRVVVDGGRNDRLSDLNVFWMARDPRRENLFTRSGRFEDYDDLALYYVGIGGNRNTTTRLRRYGDGRRELVGEFTDAAHLLAPNRDYRIEIAVYDGCTRVRVDGADWFTYRDPHPLASGYLGLRTTWSRQTVDDLTIQRLE